MGTDWGMPTTSSRLRSLGATLSAEMPVQSESGAQVRAWPLESPDTLSLSEPPVGLIRSLDAHGPAKGRQPAAADARSVIPAATTIGSAPSSATKPARMLLYALTWPAVWLERRGLTCSPTRYQSLIADRLDAIAAHGDPARYGAYFPAYLLKCLQDWFQRWGDELYAELKHIRNALDQVLASARFAARVQRHAQHIDLLVATHRLLHAQRSQRDAHPDAQQLPLF